MNNPNPQNERYAMNERMRLDAGIFVDVYVEDLGDQVVLTTEHNGRVTEKIYLEEHMIHAFIEFCQNRKVERTP